MLLCHPRVKISTFEKGFGENVGDLNKLRLMVSVVEDIWSTDQNNGNNMNS